LKALGNLVGLKSAVAKQIEKLFERHAGAQEFVEAALAIAVQDASIACSRRIAVVADRRGQIHDVVVGDAGSIDLPDHLRTRIPAGRLNGRRFIVSTFGEGLGQDDLELLRLFSFDAVVGVINGRTGNMPLVQPAWILPPDSGDSLWEVLEPAYPGRFVQMFDEMVVDIEVQLRRAATANLLRKGEKKASDAAIIVIPSLVKDADLEWEKSELEALCSTAGVAVLDTIVQRRSKPDPKFVIGVGKLRETAMMCLHRAADLIIFGTTLTPSQQRAIAAEAGVRVIDRNQLILDIFAKHAGTVEGRLEVELAQLRYNLPRLSERDDSMSRLSGGIGALGPGETKLEMEKRRARDRIHLLEEKIDEEASKRSIRRKRREQRSVPLVAVVGYTNAGKSTLFNTSTGADVIVENKLFATLDPTVRKLWLQSSGDAVFEDGSQGGYRGGFNILLVDTVGFIKDLPKELEGAFKATLEEMEGADLLLQVADVSDPHVLVQIESVRRIVEEMGYGETPQILVLNKADRMKDDVVLNGLAADTGGILTCAKDKDSLTALFAAIESALAGKASGHSTSY
jgi:GTP-binding protein HflX